MKHSSLLTGKFKQQARLIAAALGFGLLVICFQNFTNLPVNQTFDLRAVAPSKPATTSGVGGALLDNFQPKSGDTTIGALESDWVSQTTQPILQTAKSKITNYFVNDDGANSNKEATEKAEMKKASVESPSSLRLRWLHINTISLDQPDPSGFKMQCSANPGDLVFSVSEHLAWTPGRINIEHHTQTGISSLNIGWSW